MSLFDKWLAVILTTINPLTGRGIAIPLGLGLGLPVFWIGIVTAVSNFIMATAIILFIDQLKYVPGIKQFIERKRGRSITRFMQGKGLFYTVVLGPLVLGTFTVVIVLQTLGANKKRMILYSLISALILTPLLVWVAPIFLDIFKEYENILQALLPGVHL